MGFYDRGKWVFMRGNSYLSATEKFTEKVSEAVTAT